MRRIPPVMKKTISLLLVLSMFMTLSSTAFAAGTTKNEATAKLSTSLTLVNPFVDWALEKLGGGIISGIAGKGVNEAFGAIFGTDTDKLMSSLDAMNGRFDGINKQLDDITSQLEDLGKQLDDLSKQVAVNKLSDNLDDYSEFIKDYQDVYQQISLDIQNYADDPEMTNIYLTDLYNATDPNYLVEGNSIINSTIKLGSRLLIVQSSGYNVFGTFDSMDKYIHRWEHQGYAERQAFRDVAIATYTMYSAISQLSCETVILNNQGDDSKSKFVRAKASNWLTSLKNNATEVSNMNQRCTIVEHPNLRIYRDIKIGTDIYALWRFGFNRGMEPLHFWESFDLNLNKNPYFTNLIGVTVPERKINNGVATELWSYQLSAEMYKKIYDDYGGAATLYDIFFDMDKGNFYNYDNLPEGTRFTTNHYAQQFTPLVDVLDLFSEVVNNDAQMSSTHLGRMCSSVPSLNFTSNERFLSIERYNGVVEQGALKTPPVMPETKTDGLISGMEKSYNLPYSGSVTLSVEEKPGCTYQWLVRKDGNFEVLEGETNLTYTLPALDASMNGYQYSCSFIKNGGVDISDYTTADPVTLNLTGDGIPEAVTTHEIYNADELTDALERVNTGGWDEHTLKLMANIDYTLPISIIYYGVHMDLNGYTLNINVNGAAQPNIEPEGSTAAIAAVYVQNYGLLDLTGDGALNVVTGDGVQYGVYASRNSYACVTAVTSTNCESAIYAKDGSFVSADGVSATSENTNGVECFAKSTVDVSGSVTASGNSSRGVFIDGWNDKAVVNVGGDITVSGENSSGAFLGGENAVLNVNSNITVTDGSAGVSAGKGTAVVNGNITALANAVNVWNGANVTVKGNVTATGDDSAAVFSTGADVQISGDINATGKGSTGISVTAWDLVEPVVGAKVTVIGKINSSNPLKIENMPVEESKHTEKTSKEGYYTFTDGTSVVWSKPGSFVKIAEHDPDAAPSSQTGNSSVKTAEPDSVSALNPQTGDSSLPITMWLLLGAGALTFATITLRRRKSVRHIKIDYKQDALPVREDI